MLPFLSAGEPKRRPGWPACGTAGCRCCSCRGSGRPGSWFSSRTSAPFPSRSRRSSSASRSGSSAAGGDLRCRPSLPANRSRIYRSSSRELPSEPGTDFTPKMSVLRVRRRGGKDKQPVFPAQTHRATAVLVSAPGGWRRHVKVPEIDTVDFR